MSGYLSLVHLPLNKGYFEHPFWLIQKINFILDTINKVLKDKEK